MRWDITLEKNLIKCSYPWIKNYISTFNTNNLKWIRISSGHKNRLGVYGICRYPAEKNKGYYRISCHIPGPIPFSVHSKGKGFIFQEEGGTWPILPNGSIVESVGTKLLNGKYIKWKRIKSYTELLTYDEACVWIFGHEIYHYLRDTKQIPGRNTEIEADAYADQLLEDFRMFLS